jgi:hypothetical protein
MCAQNLTDGSPTPAIAASTLWHFFANILTQPAELEFPFLYPFTPCVFYTTEPSRHVWAAPAHHVRAWYWYGYVSLIFLKNWWRAASSLGLICALVMRDLIPYDDHEARRSRWICSHCEKVFRMSSDYVADTNTFPPVHVWIEFEEHKCHRAHNAECAEHHARV